MMFIKELGPSCQVLRILLNNYHPVSPWPGVQRADVMVPGNIEGVEKVEESNGKYAFFMESASIEYLVERRCKLSQV